MVNKKRLIGVVLTVIMLISVFTAIVTTGSATHAANVALNEIQKAIDEKGANWAAGTTSVSGLSIEEKKLLCGAKRGPIPETAIKIRPPSNVSMPFGKFDWRNVYGQNWMTSVKHQGSCGSCWIFGSTAAFEAQINIDANDSTIDFDSSEQHILSCSDGGDCDGGYPFLALRYINDSGVPDETCLPYLANDTIPCGDTCADCENRACTFERIGVPESHTTVNYKWMLENYGPMVVVLNVSEDFLYYTGGIYEPTWTSEEFGQADHCVALVGYNDTGEYWIIKNSWGPTWGEEGYGRVHYGHLEKYEYAFATVNTTYPLSPEIWVDPPGFDVTLPADTFFSTNLTIGNNGEGTLTYNITDVETTGGPCFRWVAQDPDPLPASDVLKQSGTIQILAWVLYTDYDQEYRNTLIAISEYCTDYTVTESTTTDPSVLASELVSKDVFLIPEPEMTDNATWAAIGSAFSSVLGDFVNDGGTVIVCCERDWYQGFLLNAGLMSTTYANGYSEGETFTVADQTHPIIDGLGATAASANVTASYSIADAEIHKLIVDSYGYAVVAVRDIGCGHVVINGYDYYEYNDDASRIIANAVKFGSMLEDCSWLDEDPKSGSVEPGYYDKINVTINTTGLAQGEYCAEIWIANNDPDENPTIVSVNLTVCEPEPEPFDTEQPETPYPSIFGTHNGTITPNQTINVFKMYTYPCTGTGGHSESVVISNATTGAEIANGAWTGYQGAGDYHYIEFDVPFILQGNETYHYTICTGSYPQIHHTPELLTANGGINCTKFTDANGKEYTGWIPAIRLE